VTYSEGTGGLQVSITGLPGGTNASVTINGPNSYTQTLTASQTLSGLTPGDYTVSAQGVTSGGVTYNAGVSGSPATVTTGSTAQVSVTYTLAQPTISGFTAAPGTITQGDYSTLSWSTSNATSASIDQGIGSVPVNGNRDVNPSTTTPYTLTASNAAGTPTRTCTVYVNAQAPTGVDATDGSSTGYVRITWSGFPGNWFQVYRNTGNSNSGATWIGGWQQGTSYDDTTATPGRTYWYWVKAATDSSGNHQSGWSNSEFGWTKLSPPTNVNAADGTSTNSVAVTWGSTSGYGTIYYHVYRNTSNNRSGAQPIGNWETDTSYTDTTATPAGTTYWYWVDAAVDSSGTRSSDPGGPDTGYMHINQLTASGQHPETIKRTSSGTATVYSTSSTMFGQDDDGSTSGPLYYGFVWFDLTGLPSSCTVTGVSLSFGSLTIDCQVSNQNYSMNTNSGIITSVSYSTWTGQSASAKLGYSRDNTLATSFSYSSPPASTWTWGLGDTVIQNGPRRLVLWRFDTVSYRDLPCIIPGCDWWKCTVGGLVLRVTYSMP
jgi:hypothetical protein